MYQIDDYVEAMFSALPKNDEVEETKRRILEHMQETFEVRQKEGMNENEALGAVISEFGSMEEIKHTFGLEEKTKNEESEVPNALERLLQEYAAFLPRLRIGIAVSVGLFILSPFTAAALDSSMAMFTMISIGTGLLIYFLGRKKDYRGLIREQKDILLNRDIFLNRKGGESHEK